MPNRVACEFKVILNRRYLSKSSFINHKSPHIK